VISDLTLVTSIGVSSLKVLEACVSVLVSHFLGLTAAFLETGDGLALTTLDSPLFFLIVMLFGFGVIVCSLIVFLMFFSFGLFPFGFCLRS
jgi:hypothetical protein